MLEMKFYKCIFKRTLCGPLISEQNQNSVQKNQHFSMGHERRSKDDEQL